MLTAWIVVFGLLIVFGDAANNFEQKIVGGRPASPGEFPYQVSLQAHESLICGGSIVSKYHVVTAAHCIRNPRRPGDLSVVVGSTDLRNNPGARYQVSKIQLHKGYDIRNNWLHDIAMLKVSTAIQFNRNVQPATLPRSGATFRAGQSATISGYGRLKLSGGSSPVLYKTQVLISSDNQCQRRPGNICTYHPSRVTGFCKGDSGGPLSVNGEVVGIVSWSNGYGCAGGGQYSQVYTRVSYYRNWIEYMMNYL